MEPILDESVSCQLRRAAQITRRRPTGWSLPWRQADEWILVWNITGREQLSWRATSAQEPVDRVLINPGDCYLLPPDCPNRIRSPDGNTLAFCHLAMPLPDPPAAPMLAGTGWAALVRQRLPGLIQQSRSGEPLQRRLASVRAADLVLTILQNTGGATHPPAAADNLEARLLRAETWARDLIPETISVDDLAEVAGYSRTRFSMHYKNHRGIGPGQFLRRLRLAWAAERLRQNGESVTAIAHMSGYREAAAFNRAFCKEYGSTPGEWRRDQ